VVTVKPIKERVKTNWPTLVKGLNENIINLNKDIDERDRTIAELEAEIASLKEQLANAKSAPSSEKKDLPEPDVTPAPKGPSVTHMASPRTHTRQRSQLPTNIIAMFNMAQDEIEEADEINNSQLLVADVKEADIDAEVDKALKETNQLRGDTDAVASVFGEKTEEIIRTGRESTINLLKLNEARSSHVGKTTSQVDSRSSIKLPTVTVAQTTRPSTTQSELDSDNLDMLDEEAKLEDLEINFEDPQLQLDNLSRTQLIDHCDVLRSMLEAEKTLNESYLFSQQVIIDHLAETNEGLLAYFRVKFQVLGDGKKKKKKNGPKKTKKT